jgi:hypothetical protein
MQTPRTPLKKRTLQEIAGRSKDERTNIFEIFQINFVGNNLLQRRRSQQDVE